MTFEQFPDRLRHVVQESLAALDSEEEVVVESKVFPVFETKGELVSPASFFRFSRADDRVASSDGPLRRMAHGGDRRARVRNAESCKSRAVRTQHGRALDRRRGYRDQAV